MICVCSEMTSTLDEEIWFKVTAHHLPKDTLEVEHGADWPRGENIWTKGFFKDFAQNFADFNLRPRNMDQGHCKPFILRHSVSEVWARLG